MMYIAKTNIFDLQDMQILCLNWTGTPHHYKNKKKFLNTV